MRKAYLSNISKLFSVIVFFVVLATQPMLGANAVYADNQVQCQKHTLPVTLSEINPIEYQMEGWLCYQGSLQGKTVQVLVSGITYDHFYWDFPYEPSKYSYVKNATEAGYATFNIDRIGVGESDRPLLATDVNVYSGAHVVHQVVQKLRAGAIADHAFSKVILTAHSFGSSISLVEASKYQDVDGLILTGFMHQVSNDAYPQFLKLHPAQTDPKFMDQDIPPGYLTTMPNTRGGLFYYQADPNVIALDEKLKQTVTEGEVNTITAGNTKEISQKIQVPVLTAVGTKDLIFCDDSGQYSCATTDKVLEREKPYYNSNVCLDAYVMTETGHNINLHPKAPEWFEYAANWADKYVGKSTSEPPTSQCGSS